MRRTNVLSHLTAAVLFFLTSSAFAAWHTSTITQVYPLNNGNVIVIFAADSPLCTNANAPNYYLIGIGHNGVTELGLKHMVATALTAAAAGYLVTINFDETVSSCAINRLSVTFDS